MKVAFFVTGHGRSGTKWLAKVLNNDPSISVHHEPINADVPAYQRIHAGTLSPEWYMEARERKMLKIWERKPDLAYAEVNSYLRYCVPALQEHFNVPIVGLVRDGRYVVRSMMLLGCYQRENYPPIPADGTTPFEKCCWYWKETYHRLLKDGLSIFRLEKLDKSFDFFYELCDRIGATVTKEQWERHAGKRVNVRVGDVSLTWGEEKRRIFNNIAGEMNAYFGYESCAKVAKIIGGDF